MCARLIDYPPLRVWSFVIINCVCTSCRQSVAHLINHHQSLYAFNFWSCFVSTFIAFSTKRHHSAARQDAFPWNSSIFSSFHFIFSCKKVTHITRTFMFCATINDQFSEIERQKSNWTCSQSVCRQWQSNLPTVRNFLFN